MTELITSYNMAANIHAKARKPEAGKPLGPRGWRLHKDGDEYVVYCFGTQVARFLPDNTLRIVLPVGALANPISIGTDKVLPVAIARRSTGHYRLHIRVHDKLDRQVHSSHFALYGLSGWSEWTTKGCRVYDGLTIDLATRKAITPTEIVHKVVSSDARKEWLSKSGKLKTHLKTIAKLGGFTARVDALRDTHKRRWEIDSPDIFDLLLAAFRQDDMESLAQGLAVRMFRRSWATMDVSDQRKFIDKVFSDNSLNLRMALGVIEEVME
jgi:hypothetical protein